MLYDLMSYLLGSKWVDGFGFIAMPVMFLFSMVNLCFYIVVVARKLKISLSSFGF